MATKEIRSRCEVCISLSLPFDALLFPARRANQIPGVAQPTVYVVDSPDVADVFELISDEEKVLRAAPRAARCPVRVRLMGESAESSLSSPRPSPPSAATRSPAPWRVRNERPARYRLHALLGVLKCAMRPVSTRGA